MLLPGGRMYQRRQSGRQLIGATRILLLVRIEPSASCTTLPMQQQQPIKRLRHCQCLDVEGRTGGCCSCAIAPNQPFNALPNDTLFRGTKRDEHLPTLHCLDLTVCLNVFAVCIRGCKGGVSGLRCWHCSAITPRRPASRSIAASGT